MPTTRRKSKKQTLIQRLSERNITAIGSAEWNELLDELAPISENYLRRLLHETGLPFAQPYAGVRQGDFEELEQSLVEMEKVYSAAVAKADREGARFCRRLVIQAKDHARLALRNQKIDPLKRARKEEMVEWMLVWLGSPDVFPAWVRIRKQKMEAANHQ